MVRGFILLLLVCSASVATATTRIADGKPNRLLEEASPYLQQHAYNPVDWYPWGKEAFEKARRENKPILLSVGYSTCHWCHVMEEESYSDPKIARALNEGFVAIKVDRERRPDVDETYLLATQLLTNSSGGWPNHVFLTPDLKPFFAGTYFPPGVFRQTLRQVSLYWAIDMPTLQREGERVARIIRVVMSRRAAARDVTRSAVDGAVTELTKNLDRQYGGLGLQPKFPHENVLLFLLDQAEKYDTPQALEAVTKTLNGMLHGGIHDQVGGGFHRYAVDRKWLVPHFEKMLFNQAGVGRALVQAWRITGNRRYYNAARNLFDFVLRDLTAPGSGFYSAYDADSPTADGETKEGLYYVWTKDDLREALGKDDANFAAQLFGVTFEGNFEGRNILHLPRTVKDFAASAKITEKDLDARLENIRRRLLDFRKGREPPSRDDKILTGWNGYMILALAEAAQNFGVDRYKDAAIKAGEFFWNEMGGKDGALARYSYRGTRQMVATQTDYALLALSFVKLYDASGDKRWLDRSIEIATKMNDLFLDRSANDYYLTTANSGFYRPKLTSDGNTPSGTAVALELFAKLARRTLDTGHRTSAEAILSSISGVSMGQPQSHAYSLRAADTLLRGETGARINIANGRVIAAANAAEYGRMIMVKLKIADGWHVNAHTPLEKNFIGTNVKFPGFPCRDRLTTTYPIPIRRKLGFHNEELALLEGQVDITVTAETGAKLPKRLALTLQACSDRICLQPETVRLSVVPHH